jgi:uncharacterized protein Yka (UPF0111/DUF47 family)
MLRELPVVRSQRVIPGLRYNAPLIIDSEREDVGYLLTQADDVADAADQLASVLAAHGNAVVVAD